MLKSRFLLSLTTCLAFATLVSAIAIVKDDAVVRTRGKTDAEVLPLVGKSTPLDIVNQRMSAYNRHDLRALLETYSDSIEIFTYPHVSLGKGKEHIRWVFEDMFRKAVVQVEVHHQFTIDSYVVNHETVNYGTKTTDYVSIYEVKNGLIRSVTFVRD